MAAKTPPTVVALLVPEFYDKESGSAKTALCLHCQAVVGLGGKSQKGVTNRAMVQHLERQDHAAPLARYSLLVKEAEEAKEAKEEEAKAKKKPASRQPTLKESFERRQPFPKDSDKDKTFQALVLEMLVKDGLPFEFVEGAGFRRLVDFLADGRAKMVDESTYRRHLEMQHDAASLGPVQHFLGQLERHVRSAGTGFGTMRQAFDQRLAARFASANESPFFGAAAALDPRFQCRGFSEQKKALVINELERLELRMDQSQPDASSPAPDANPAPAKRPRQEPSLLWASASRSNDSEPGADQVTLRQEFAEYAALPRQSPDSSPLDYWDSNLKFPRLRRVAKYLLCACPSQCACEQFFSTVGGIATPKRCSLTPANLEMIAFLQRNLPLVEKAN
jgi:hypothetical protein